ncbi:MAG: hypothetical protein ACKO37_06790 [Vampirovibrionales bacterium]
MMMQQIFESRGSQYHDESPTGTKEYLYLWAALNKFGRANCSDWTGKEVFLKNVVAFYSRQNEKVMRWNRHKTWKYLQTLKREHSELSWQDILKDKCGLSEENKQKFDFLTLANIVEDWARFDKAKLEFLSALGDGHLKAYFLEGNGDNHLLKKEFWKAENAWEVFENSDSDFERYYKQHSIFRNFLDLKIYSPYDSTTEKRGTICVKKDDLDNFLSGNKEEVSPPATPEMTAESIIQFLETKGYVSHFVKIIIILLAEHTMAEHTSDKGALLDLAKKTNFKELGFSDEEVVRIKEAMKNKASKFTKDIPGILWPRMPKN